MVNIRENAAAAYRRGSVLGLTVGEIFLLLSFILLLFLLLKQAEVDEKQAEVDEKQAELEEKQDDLSRLEKDLRDVRADLYNAEDELRQAPLPIEDLVAISELVNKPGRKDLLIALDDVSEEAVTNLAEAFEDVDSPEDLASNVGDFGGVDPYTLTRGLTIARTIQDLDPRISEEEVADALEIGTEITENLSDAEWNQLQNLMEAVDWSPNTLARAVSVMSQLEEDSDSSLAAQIGAALEEAAQRSLTLANSLERSLGDVVEARGGRIDARGTISFSDTTLFPRGRSDLTADMRQFLDELCLPWLSTLKQQGFEIEEIRIEGHASPGWVDARTEQDAYLKNLELSQARARVVLEYCIDQTWEQNLGQWARERSVAIGFSSSRPVVVGGEISLDASQRVLLSAAPDISDIMQEIQDTVDQ